MPINFDGMEDDELWDATRKIADAMIEQAARLKTLAENRGPPTNPAARKQFIESLIKMGKNVNEEANQTYDEIYRRFNAWTGQEGQGG